MKKEDAPVSVDLQVPNNSLAQFEQDLPTEHMAPLWRVIRDLGGTEPRVTAKPHRWGAATWRDRLTRAGELITADAAERRVLVLENPGLAGKSLVAPSLFAGVQLILPGEIAPSHRHSAAALRLVLAGSGAYTAVDGERVRLHAGDFLVTPSWVFHDHGNDGEEAVMWLDGLDIPIVNTLGLTFGERHPQKRQPVVRPEGDCVARYTQCLAPIERPLNSRFSPAFHYPYERTRVALDGMRRANEWDPSYGLKLRFIDPLTGTNPIPTLAAMMQLIPAAFHGEHYRSTDSAVFSVVAGQGVVKVGPERWQIGPGDIFVIPGWTWYAFDALQDLVLFSFSDRPLQDYLNLWREERRNNHVSS